MAAFLNFLRKRNPAPETWMQIKAREMEKFFGPVHKTARHSDVPFSADGFLDLHYYPDWGGDGSTAILTHELINEDGSGNRNDLYDAYELVMFTRHKFDLKNAFNAQTPFGRTHRQINSILNAVARYGAQTIFNSLETATLPSQMPEVGGHHLIFDAWQDADGAVLELPCKGNFGIMLVMQLLPSEMQFIEENGTDALVNLLLENEVYPNADLDREPVV
ncbi:MAG: suppressor of fused domain protein [Puniceicoccales bacterium]|jgi:hypothetical protein|nr:suppressor of fused domain protein [Puniceicoccales bacterium]